MAPATAQAALEVLWLAMIELAETSNDGIVSHHRQRSLTQTRRIASLAADLSVLANGAVILARHAEAKR